MFGRLSAYGFFCRHVRGLRLSRMQLDVIQPDSRPSLVCEDVKDLEVFGWRALSVNESPSIVLKNVQEALIHGCKAAAGTSAYLRVRGKQSQKISLVANDLSQAAQTVARDADAPASAVDVQGAH